MRISENPNTHNRLVVGSIPTEPTREEVITLSCYFRHLKDIFAKAGIEVIPGNKKQIDRAIHQLVGNSYKDCPGTWRKLKPIIADEQKRPDFIVKLKSAVR